MIYLWISILSSALIYLTFKILPRFNANLKGAIIVNYLLASILGFVFNHTSFNYNQLIHASWLPIAATIGLLFVIMFFLIGLSTSKAGISVTTIATRMSMVIPIFFSMFFFNENVSTSKVLKIALATVAVILAVYHKPEKNLKLIYTLLPIILFIGSGSVDALVKTAQHLYVPENQIELFSSSLFGISFIASLIFLVTKKKEERIFTSNSLIIGILLGLFNFGSLFFLMNALNKSKLDSSLVFGINNLSIVCISLLIGFLIFKEKLTKANWIGVILSIISIIVLIQF